MGMHLLDGDGTYLHGILTPGAW